MCLICKSRLKSAISSTSVIESESGEWHLHDEEGHSLCSVQVCTSLLVWTEFSMYYLGLRDHTIVLQRSSPIYISTTCWTSQCSTGKCVSTHPLIYVSALYMHSSKQKHVGPIWMGQNVWCDLHVGLAFLLKDHCCPGDISVSPASPPLLQANTIQLCRVCGAVHLTHLLPVANINNKAWYKRLKVSKTAHEERRRNQCMLSLP